MEIDYVYGGLWKTTMCETQKEDVGCGGRKSWDMMEGKQRRPVAYVHCVMHKCIMVKLGGETKKA